MKKGIEAETLVIIIIILVSFAIILFFLRIFPAEEKINKETCRLSVEMRNLPVVGGIEKAIAPLRCKTEYYCFKKKGKCPVGYKKIQIKGTKEGYDIEDIKMRIANAMYDCWWQMGEGKLVPFRQDILQKFALARDDQLKCSICSVIAFDDKLAKEKIEIDLWSFLEKENVPGTNKTYLQYFSEQEDVELPLGVHIPTITTDKKYAIYFFFFKAEKYREVLRNNAIALGLGTGTALIAGMNPVAGKIIGKIGHLFKSPYLWVPTTGIILGISIAQAIGTFHNMKIANLYCNWAGEKLETEKGMGCYMLLLTEFIPKEISSYCVDLEGIP